MTSNKAQNEDRKGGGREIGCFLRGDSGHRKQALTVDACTPPVVCVPLCKDGRICAQEHPCLGEEKNLSLSFNLSVFASSLNCVK